MRIAILAVAGTLFLYAVVYGQSSTKIYIPGEITVLTSDSLAFTFVAVAGQSWGNNVRSAEKEFAFCIAHAKPLASRLDYKGKGRVIYRTSPDKASTRKPAGPEPILPALGVLRADGEIWWFLAEGQPYPHPPHERSAGWGTTFRSADVTRQDYVDRNGRRRGTAASSCFATKRR